MVKDETKMLNVGRTQGLLNVIKAEGMVTWKEDKSSWSWNSALQVLKSTRLSPLQSKQQTNHKLSGL